MLARGLVNAPGYRADVATGLFDGDTVAQAPGRTVVVRCPTWVFPFQVGWHPQIGVTRETKSCREHADNREDRRVNLQVGLREIPRRPQILPPVFMADENCGAGSLSRVADGEIAPEERLNTEHLEKVWRNGRNRSARGLRCSRNGGDAARVLGHCLEAAGLVSKIVEVRIRQTRRPALRSDLEDRHDPVRVTVGQRPQQHAVDDAEDCRGHTDAEGQGEDGDGCEARILAELTKCVAAVCEHRLEPVAFVATLLQHAGHISFVFVHFVPSL